MEVQVQKTSIFSMKTLGHWLCAITGLFSGGIAYLHIPDFLQVHPDGSDALKKVLELLWTITVAGVTTVTGLAVKYWWDQQGKKIMHRIVNKKKKR